MFCGCSFRLVRNCNSLFPRRFLLQTLQHGSYDQGQTYCSVRENLAELPTFGRRHKLAPGNDPTFQLSRNGFSLTL